MKTLGIFCIAMSIGMAAGAQSFDEVDALFAVNKATEAQALLETMRGSSRSQAEQAQVLWRLARAQQLIGDERERSGASEEVLLETFDRGVNFAQEAIDLNPDDSRAYFWKAACIGRWGQTKGILDSLFKAGDMRDLLITALEMDPEFAAAYRVMGQLHFAVPGWPVSFGDKDKAVSFFRQSIAFSTEDPSESADSMLKLAEALISRNWNSRDRQNNQDWKKRDRNKARTAWEKGSFYEGVVSLGNESDREEARKLINLAINLKNQANPPGYVDEAFQRRSPEGAGTPLRRVVLSCGVSWSPAPRRA
jgi:tetratricopeptide (TPR) repeat protein